MKFFKSFILLILIGLNTNRSKSMIIPIAGAITAGTTAFFMYRFCVKPKKRDNTNYLSQTSFTQKPKKLINNDNRCYSNALMQVLMQNPDFFENFVAFSNMENKTEEEKYNIPVVKSYSTSANNLYEQNPYSYLIYILQQLNIKYTSIKEDIHLENKYFDVVFLPEQKLIGIISISNDNNKTYQILENITHENKTYELAGIICTTRDSSDFQHFYSFIKSNKEWFLCDDDKIINLSKLWNIYSYDELRDVMLNNRQINISYTKEGPQQTIKLNDGSPEIKLPGIDIEHVIDNLQLKKIIDLIGVESEQNIRANSLSGIKTNKTKYINPIPFMLFYTEV